MKIRPIKIIKNKMDIAVALLVISTIIPILANTFVSLDASIKTVIIYIYAFLLYILARTIIPKNDKFAKILNIIIVVITTITIIIGIDAITTKGLTQILNKLKIPIGTNGEDRLQSIFKYVNTFSAFIMSVVFLNFNLIGKSKKQSIRAIYKTITFILFIGIILTYSKAVFIIMPILIIGYIVSLKEKENRKYIIENILLSLVMSLIYCFVFEKCNMIQNYFVSWIILIILVLLAYSVNILIERIKQESSLRRINKRVLLLVVIIAFVFFISYIIVGLNIYDEYKVFSSGVDEDYKAKIINNLQPNTEYIFEFYIESTTPKDNDIFTINLLERNKKNKEVANTQIEFGTYSGIKKITVKTQPDTAEIKIEFKSKYKYLDKNLTIKKLLLNNQEIPLEYKILPTKLIEKIKNINIHYKTAVERIEMIKDAIRLSKDNWLTGIGGDGWKYKYKEIQSYNYTANMLHSYTAKILLEFGILGIIAYLGICVLLIEIFIKIIKRENTEQLSILFSLLAIWIHSMIDIDMEFVMIMLYEFALLGIVANNLKQNEKDGNILINLIVLLILFANIYFNLNDTLYSSNKRITNLIRNKNGLRYDSEEYMNINSKLIKEYENITKYEKYDYAEKNRQLIEYYANDNTQKEKISRANENLLNYTNKEDYDISSVTEKIRSLYSVVKILSKQYIGYEKIINNDINKIIEEYPETLEKIKNMENDEEKGNKINELENIYKEIQEIKKQYCCGIKIINDSDIEIDEELVSNAKLELNKNILLYHTHTSESFKANEKYEMYKNYRSLDENYNIVRIGNVFEESLTEMGFNVIHNSEYFDLPSTTGAYKRSRVKVESILEKNNISTIIDVHRDSYSEVEHTASTVEIDGERYANLRFVIATDMEKEKVLKNLKLAIELQRKAEEKYPGLFLPIIIRNENYNQDLSEYAILLEVGENCNTIEETQNSVKILAEIMKDVY